MEPSADCAEARPFHCDSGFARTTAKDASLTAAIAMAFAICCSLRPSSRPAAALSEKASCVVWSNPLRHEVGVIDKPGLDAVAQRHPEHQVAAAAAHILGDGQRHAEIIRRMAGLGLRKEVVHEIDIAHECGVPERGVDRVSLPATNQRGRAGAAELRDLLATGLDRAGSQGGDAAAQRVKDMDWQLPARFGREVGESSAGGILGESFRLESSLESSIFILRIDLARLSGR